MKKRLTSTTKALLAALLLLTGNYLHAQVTIGNGSAPTYGALLDLKSQQAGTVTAVDDDANITSTKGGLLLPRVKLLSFTSLDPVMPGGDALTAEEKLKLAGLMVYNINVVAYTLDLGVYVWNGEAWAYPAENKTAAPITAVAQPKEFTFYETDLGSVTPLTFTVAPPRDANGVVGTVTYQWYRVTSNNIHIKMNVGTAIGGATSDTYTPGFVLKGATNNANNVGFYRFYCVATGSDGSTVQSDVAEIAVGCGAKDNLGEWISFMCFNLGAQNNISIQQQKNYNLSSGEQNLYGSLFQWGRIADGHELRNKASEPITGLTSTTDIGSGNQCAGWGRPWLQIKPTSVTWYGKFIYGSTNWNPHPEESSLNILWNNVHLPNDPCAHFKENATGNDGDSYYQPFWYNGSNPDACTTGAAWRIPTQSEWGAIYRSGTLSGTPTQASANNWEWYINGSNTGYEIKPDGQTTTLFLPANGYRHGTNDGFIHAEKIDGRYWSSVCTSPSSAHPLYFGEDHVHPGHIDHRSYGMALRCIKQ